MKRFAMLGAVALGTLSVSGSVQAAPDACPSGIYQIVRSSQIKPGGTVAGFAKAIADHAAWYASHGYTKDGFAWGQVMAMDPTTHAPMLKAGEYVTIHTSATDVPKDKHDAAWDAYVAEYQANSMVTATTILCMAK